MNKLIKSLMLIAVVGFAGAAYCDLVTNDSYLYWMIDEADFNSYSSLSGTTYAKVKWSDGSSSGYLLNGNYGAEEDSVQFSSFTTEQYALIGSTMLSSSYSFLVEFYSDKDSLLGNTATVLGSSFGSSTGSSTLIGEAYTFSIPEPTSGMLALLGFGLLALRRKQKNA